MFVSSGKIRIYYPQIPVDPKYFAGRNSILQDIESIVESTQHGKPENVALCGVRGIGKTSLGFKIREKVPDTCFLAYYAAPKELDSKDFVDAMLEKVFENEKLLQKIAKAERDNVIRRESIESLGHCD